MKQIPIQSVAAPRNATIYCKCVFGALVFCTLLSAASGCGGEPQRYAVSGEVKWRDKALDYGAILFLSEDARAGSSGGAAIKDGRYTIATGLPAGRYKVSISSAEPGGSATGPPPKDRVSPEYNVETTLTAEVKAEGPNVFDFAVE